MPDEYTIIIGLEVHVQLGDGEQAVLWMQHEIRGGAEYANVPGVHRGCRGRCR